MYLIAGLGNPGLKYRKTPHNAGFMALDALADALGARFSKKGNGKVAEARIGGATTTRICPWASCASAPRAARAAITA